MIIGQSPATFETPVLKKIESTEVPKVLDSDNKETIDLSKSPGKINICTS